MAPRGKQADEVLAERAVAGKDYICVVRGRNPTVPATG